MEGNKPYGEDPVNGVEPFDYLEQARKRREEREAKQAAEKAEKEALRKKEREERLAKQLARSAAKREERIQKIEEKAKDTSEKVEEVREEVDKSKEEIKQAEQILEPKNEPSATKPVEMVFGEGSEFTDSDLSEGSEAIFDLKKTVQKAEEKLDVADEVLARAEALSRARDALHILEEESRDIGSTIIEAEEGAHRAVEESIYDLSSQQDELRQRLNESWSVPIEQVKNTQDQAPIGDVILPPVEVSAEYTEVSSQNSDGPGSLHESNLPVLTPAENVTARATNTDSELRTSRKPNTGAAFLSGWVASRLGNRRSSLEKATRSLRSETEDLRRDIVAEPKAAPEYKPLTRRTDEVQPQAPINVAADLSPKTQKTFEAPSKALHPHMEQMAIPSWVKQIEFELSRGKLPELKKWQKDILKNQHPDILNRYESLDKKLKKEVSASAEYAEREHHAEIIATDRPKAVLPDNSSTALPVPLSTFNADPQPIVNQYFAAPYGTTHDRTKYRVSVTSSGFVTAIVFGGALFGAFLIVAFGL